MHKVHTNGSLTTSGAQDYDSKEPPKGKVIYMIAEGDLVMAFNSYMYPVNKEIVACHFLRVWDGEIVEHWDIHTLVPPS